MKNLKGFDTLPPRLDGLDERGAVRACLLSLGFLDRVREFEYFDDGVMVLIPVAKAYSFDLAIRWTGGNVFDGCLRDGTRRASLRASQALMGFYQQWTETKER